MLSDPSDREVIERVLEGDTEAFGLLVDRYQGVLAAYAKYLTGSRDEAEDIVQESFVRAFKALRKCKDPNRFKGWLFRIVIGRGLLGPAGTESSRSGATPPGRRYRA